MRAAILALLLSGCSLLPTRTVYVEPECETPPRPALPTIERERMEPLDDETYWLLQERETELVSWALDLEAIVHGLCD